MTRHDRVRESDKPLEHSVDDDGAGEVEEEQVRLLLVQVDREAPDFALLNALMPASASIRPPPGDTGCDQRLLHCRKGPPDGGFYNLGSSRSKHNATMGLHRQRCGRCIMSAMPLQLLQPDESCRIRPLELSLDCHNC